MTIFLAKFLVCCKKQWKIITGFFIGIVAVLLTVRRGPSKKLLQKKGEMQDDISESETVAREKLEEEYKKNLESFLDKNEEIEDEAKEKLRNLDSEKSARVRELLESSDPDAEIAKALTKLL